jgi:hypothetical protein
LQPEISDFEYARRARELDTNLGEGANMLVSHRHFLPVVAGLFLANIFPALGQEFPDGPGKQVVTAVCGGCHDINRIRIGYTPEGWRTVVRMMQNVETPVPADQWDSVTEYLIKSFPERPRPAAVVLSGLQGMAGADTGFATT